MPALSFVAANEQAASGKRAETPISCGASSPRASGSTAIRASTRDLGRRAKLEPDTSRTAGSTTRSSASARSTRRPRRTRNAADFTSLGRRDSGRVRHVEAARPLRCAAPFSGAGAGRRRAVNGPSGHDFNRAPRTSRHASRHHRHDHRDTRRGGPYRRARSRPADYVRRFARRRTSRRLRPDPAVGHFSNAADGFIVASFAAAATERIRILLAHRPGVIVPSAAARIATLDVFSGGRLALNVVSGGDDADLQRDGDFVPHDARYRRTGEYLDVLKRIWQADAPVDHDGAFYRLRGASPLVRGAQRRRTRARSISAVRRRLRWRSRANMPMSMTWGEPLASVREQILRVAKPPPVRACAAHQRVVPADRGRYRNGRMGRPGDPRTRARGTARERPYDPPAMRRRMPFATADGGGPRRATCSMSGCGWVSRT